MLVVATGSEALQIPCLVYHSHCAVCLHGRWGWLSIGGGDVPFGFQVVHIRKCTLATHHPPPSTPHGSTPLVVCTTHSSPVHLVSPLAPCPPLRAQLPCRQWGGGRSSRNSNGHSSGVVCVGWRLAPCICAHCSVLQCQCTPGGSSWRHGSQRHRGRPGGDRWRHAVDPVRACARGLCGLCTLECRASK